MNPEKIFITKPDHSAPETGFFAVIFTKGGLERPVRVRFERDNWIVALDGYVIGMSQSWRAAFERIGAEKEIIGRRINENEYSALLHKRWGDIANGVDINAPDLLTTPVPRIK